MGVMPETQSTEYRLEDIVTWGTHLTFEEAKTIFTNTSSLQRVLEDINDLKEENYEGYNLP
jgi:hypothetical protein